MAGLRVEGGRGGGLFGGSCSSHFKIHTHTICTIWRVGAPDLQLLQRHMQNFSDFPCTLRGCSGAWGRVEGAKRGLLDVAVTRLSHEPRPLISVIKCAPHDDMRQHLPTLTLAPSHPLPLSTLASSLSLPLIALACIKHDTKLQQWPLVASCKPNK